jgi:ABC-type glycerol-3-phosphate transport system substrate-binding protein
MKTHAKWSTVLLTALLLVSLVGCTTPGAETPQPTGAPPAATTAVEPSPAQPEATTVVPEATAAEPQATEPTSGDAITLRYANWNLGTEEENNLQRQMVAAYTELHPNVTVEFVDMSAEGGWDAVLTSYAAKGELPDVFMANNVPLYVANGWLADLTDLVASDPDWANVPQVLKDGVTYDGQVLGVPAAQFIMGYFVNQDLYEAANLDAPAYGVSPDEFFTAATELSDVSQGVLGLDEQEFMVGWYPSTQDPALKWFSFDGANMNYNSPAFKEAIATAQEMKPHTWQGLTDEQKANFTSQGPWELFLNQEAGVRWEGGWAIPGFVSDADFNWDFVGIPGGNQAMVADIMVVSATTADVQAAYDFAKWMSFSSEAYAKEVELAEAMETAPKMPVSVSDESIELYLSFVDKPGIRQALENLDNSLVESLAKMVPGYINARWEGKPGIDIGADTDVNMGYMFANAIAGTYKYEDYSAQLEEFANQILADASAELNP